MLITRICQISLAPIVRTSGIRAFVSTPAASPKQQFVRTFAEDARNSFSERLAKRRTLRERAMAPAGETAFNAGKGALAGGAALGLGALCFYGLGFSKQSGIVDQAILWPDYVKKRIKATYLFFGSSLAITAGSAAAMFQSPKMMQLLTKNSFTAMAVTLVAVIGSGMVVQSMAYHEGFGGKHLAWLAHSGIMGAVIAPICLLGGPIIVRAAWYTLGVIGGLSTVAVCAPSEKFLYMGGPLAIGLGVVMAASIGSMFLPPTAALGAGLYSISLYGGLLLFSGFMLYDTQRIVRMAETYPQVASRPYDPINASISIYLDTINIFIRIAVLLAGGGGSRK